ncbi:AI-2E family transporter [Allorhizobium taibaishanense]|uniref:AI-2E family transporter n=1 Tax=Allorhizobium taibaishanense TaxID=887144 RepID=A0A1Q9A2F6_9HYPH|nr:AI-2E family transporter [Allorhizobium taibaishanense]
MRTVKNDSVVPSSPVPVRRTAAERNALVAPTSAARWLLLAVLMASAYFFYGFIVPMLAAMVIGFASWPIYRRILVAAHGNRTIGATIAIILVVSFIVIPISLAGVYAVDEVKSWGVWALKANEVGAPVPPWLMQVPLAGSWLSEHWDQYVGHPGALGELVQLISGANIGTIYRGLLVVGSSAFHSILTLLFMLIALFFVYRDGERIVEQVDVVGDRILPGRWQRVSRLVPLTISSTVTGMSIIAVGEGIVLGFAYWIAGVPSPVTLGIITGFMALIPGGAPLSFTLVSIYLVASGSMFSGLGLLAWGTVELFIVDKTLRPRLVGGPIKLPFLPTFFGLIGGVKTMGMLGLFVGPVLMAILVAIWREWIHEAREPS